MLRHFLEITSFMLLIIGVVKMLRLRKGVPQNQIVTSYLTKKEKLLVWLVCFFNPLLGGAIFYYGLRKRLPQKARQANRISLAAFLLILAILILAFLKFLLDK